MFILRQIIGKRTRRARVFPTLMLTLIALSTVLTLMTSFTRNVQAIPPNTLVVRAGDSSLGINEGAIECALKASTATLAALDNGSGGGFGVAQSISGATSGLMHDALSAIRTSPGDSSTKNVNFIYGYSLDAGAPPIQQTLCGRSLLFIQDPANSAQFVGAQNFTAIAVEHCDVKLTNIDFIAQTVRTGDIRTGNNCASARDSAQTMNVESLGNLAPGAGNGGEFLNYTYRWKDVETIEKGHTLTGGGPSAFVIDEVFKWSSYWGGNDDIVYTLDAPSSPTLTASRAPLLDGRVTNDGSGESCKPYLRFSQDGEWGGDNGTNNNVLDFGMDDGNANAGFENIKTKLSSGNFRARYHNFTVSGAGCTKVVANSDEWDGNAWVPVEATHLKLWFEYFPGNGQTQAVGIFNAAGPSERKFLGYYKLNTTEPTRLVMEGGCTVIKTELVMSRSMIDVTDGDIITGKWSAATSCGPPDVSVVDIPIEVRVKGMADIAPASLVTNPSGDGTEGDNVTCFSQGGPLGWVLCPVLGILDTMTRFLEEQIKSFLFVDMGQLSSNKDIYNSWSIFRSIATVIIVIIALIMIFSQSFGAGIFDNYSVKKILPRLLIAGIGIQLSWILIVALVNVVNVLGDGIGNLMLSPFGLTSTTGLTELIKYVLPDLSGTETFTGLVIIGVAGYVLIGVFVALAIGAALALFTGFITLIVRNMIILLGVVFAPLAIAMSVLPGTQKTSKLWWESLEKALIMYPIVIALLATGKIVSKLLIDQSGGEDNLKMAYVIAAIIAWYAPFFFLPKALQAGGSALAKISGLAGDKSKGWGDRAKKWNDSRKDVLKKNSEGNRNERLGSNAMSARIRRPFDRIAAGSVGGIRRGSRQAFNRANTDNVEAGLKEQLERKKKDDRLGVISAHDQLATYRGDLEIDKINAQRIELNGQNQMRDNFKRDNNGASIDLQQAELKVDQLQANASRFNLAAAQGEMQLKEASIAAQQADVTLKELERAGHMVTLPGAATSSAFNYSSSDDLAALFRDTSQSDAIRQAALNRIMTMKGDGAARKLLSDSSAGAFATDSSGTSMLRNTRLSSEWQAAFSDKAGDVAKGGDETQAGKDFFFDAAKGEVKIPNADSVAKWSKDTWAAALKIDTTLPPAQQLMVSDHLKRMIEADPDVAASLDAGKQKEINAHYVGRGVAVTPAQKSKGP